MDSTITTAPNITTVPSSTLTSLITEYDITETYTTTENNTENASLTTTDISATDSTNYSSSAYMTSTIPSDLLTSNNDFTNTDPNTGYISPTVPQTEVCGICEPFGNSTTNYNVYTQNTFTSENPQDLLWQNKVWSEDLTNSLVESAETALCWRAYGSYRIWEEDDELGSTYTDEFEQTSVSQRATPVTPCFSVTIPELGNQTFTSYYHQYCSTYENEFLLSSFEDTGHTCYMENAIFNLRSQLTCDADIPFPSSKEYWKLISEDYDKDQTIKHSVLGVSLIALVVATIILLSFDRLRNVKTKIHVQLFIAFIIRSVVVFLNDLIEILMLNLYMKAIEKTNKRNNCRATFSPESMINLKKQAIILAESFVDPGFSSNLNSTKFAQLNSNQTVFLSSAYDERIADVFLEFANYKTETACSLKANCTYSQNYTIYENYSVLKNELGNKTYQIIHDFFFNPKEHQLKYEDQLINENLDGIIELDANTDDAGNLINDRINSVVYNSIRKFYHTTLVKNYLSLLNIVNETQQSEDISKAFHDENILSSHNMNIPNWLVFAEKFLTAMQHYAYLVWHMWLLIEAINLYMLLRSMSRRHKRYLLFISLLGWGLPAVFILVWTVVMACNTSEIWYLYQMGDGNDYQIFSWIYKGPILLIHAVNLFLFIRIMQVLVGKVRQDIAEKKAMQIDQPPKKIEKEPLKTRRDSAYSSETTGESRRGSTTKPVLQRRRSSITSIKKLSFGKISIFQHPIYKVARATFFLIMLFGLYDLAFIVIHPKAMISGSVETKQPSDNSTSTTSVDFEKNVRKAQELGGELFGFLVSIAYCYANGEVIQVLKSYYHNRR